MFTCDRLEKGQENHSVETDGKQFGDKGAVPNTLHTRGRNSQMNIIQSFGAKKNKSEFARLRTTYGGGLYIVSILIFLVSKMLVSNQFSERYLIKRRSSAAAASFLRFRQNINVT